MIFPVPMRTSPDVKVVRHEYLKKTARCLKSNWKAAAYAAKGRLCYAHKAVAHQRQQDSPQEKGQKQKHRKSKNQLRSPCRIGERRSAEIAAFLLLSNNKDPSLKKFFKGPSERIFLLTRPSRNSRRPHTRFARRVCDERIQI